MNTKTVFLLVFVSVVLTALLFSSVIPALIGTRQTPTQPCSYSISSKGGSYSSENCETSSVLYSGTNATQAIIQTLASCGVNCEILFAAGNYTLSSPISSAMSNVTFRGSGWDTVFRLSQNFKGIPLQISGSHWLVENLKIDASNQFHSNQSSTIDLRGCEGVIRNVYVTKGDFGGIDVQGCSNVVQNNYLFNTTNDGIILLNAKGAIVENNVVNLTLAHNGISLVGSSSSIIANNEIVNPALYGFGVEGISKTGEGGTSSQHDVIEGNLILGGKRGITLYNDASLDVNVVSNTISQTAPIPDWGQGIYIADNNTGVVVSNNQVTSTGVNVEAAGAPVTVQNLLIENNSMVSTYGNDGIYMTGVTESVISGNSLVDTVRNSSAFGIAFLGSTKLIVTENIFVGFRTAIFEGSGSENNTVLTNNVP